MSANEMNGREDRALEQDTVFDQQIRGAYEALDPTPEAEARMLNALKAAQAAKVESTAPATSTTPESPIQVTPVKKERKRIAPWKIAVPAAAACLALAVVGFGLVAQPSGNEVASEQVAPSLSQSYNTKDAESDTVMMAQGNEAMDVEDTGLMPPAVDDFNTEEYNAIEETGFVSAATSPLSTVSADVDTASYTNLRRLLNGGCSLSEIPTGAVRIEEMVNYFDYGYASPTGDDRFNVVAKAGQCPWNPDTQLLVLGFSTAKEVQDKPANLVFLIDVSGSMGSSDKLELLQDSFATLLEHLDGDDRVSIVTYSGQEEVVLEGAKGDDDKAILRAIYRLHADGSTNGEAGLKMAYDVAERNKIEGGVNRIVMASDGDLNVGMTSESELHDFVDKKRESGIYLSVLGFGTGNYKDNKMETLADHGNGQYHYIDSIEEAEHVLSDKLMQAVVPFADDVKLQVEFNPAQVKGYRLIGYENRAMADEDFRDDTKDAGDIGPNAQFTVAYEVALAGSAQEVATSDLKYSDTPAASGDASGEWATATLRYRAFDDNQVHEQQLAVTGTEGADTNWSFAAAVIEFGMIARNSSYVGTATLDGVLQQLDGMELNDQQAGFKQLVELAKNQGGVELDR